MSLIRRIKIFFKLGSYVKTGTTKFKTQNQIQVFLYVKCIGDFEMRVHPHLPLGFIAAHILVYLDTFVQKTLEEL